MTVTEAQGYIRTGMMIIVVPNPKARTTTTIIEALTMETAVEIIPDILILIAIPDSAGAVVRVVRTMDTEVSRITRITAISPHKVVIPV